MYPEIHCMKRPRKLYTPGLQDGPFITAFILCPPYRVSTKVNPTSLSAKRA